MGGSYNPVAADNAFAEEYANAPRRDYNMRFDPEAASIVLHEPWKKITQVPIDPTTRTFFNRSTSSNWAWAVHRSTPTWPDSASPIRCGTNSRWRFGLTRRS